VLVLNACSDQTSSGTGTAITQTEQSTGTAGPNNQTATPSPVTAVIGKDNRVVLKVWTQGWKGNKQAETFFNNAIDNYRTLHPTFTVDWQDYGDNTPAKLSETLPTNNAPDLILVNPADLYNYAAHNQLTDLEAAGGKELPSNYVQTAWDALRWDNHSYGIPWIATSRVSIINKTLWQQAGLSPSDLPKSFDDLNKNLATLRDKTPSDVTVLWLHPDPLTDFLMEGVNLYETGGDGKSKIAAFANEIAQGRWEYYNQLRKSLYLAEASLNGTEAEALKLYGQNKLITIVNGTNLLSNLKSQYPDVYKNTTVISYPLSRGKVLPMQMQAWVVPQLAQNKALALDFVQYLTSKNNELDFVKAQPSGIYVPTLKDALTDPYVTSQDEPLAQARSLIVQNFDKMRLPEQQLPQPLLPTQRDKLQAALDNAQKLVWAKQATAKDALDQAAKTWNDLLK
jgi:putative chitobiose transport system substrate-binding protein